MMKFLAIFILALSMSSFASPPVQMTNFKPKLALVKMQEQKQPTKNIELASFLANFLNDVLLKEEFKVHEESLTKHLYLETILHLFSDHRLLYKFSSLGVIDPIDIEPSQLNILTNLIPKLELLASENKNIFLLRHLLAWSKLVTGNVDFAYKEYKSFILSNLELNNSPAIGIPGNNINFSILREVLTSEELESFKKKAEEKMVFHKRLLNAQETSRQKDLVKVKTDSQPVLNRTINPIKTSNSDDELQKKNTYLFLIYYLGFILYLILPVFTFYLIRRRRQKENNFALANFIGFIFSVIVSFFVTKYNVIDKSFSAYGGLIIPIAFVAISLIVFPWMIIITQIIIDTLKSFKKAD
ncbi:MAG: hypothetical protein HOP07_10240 [Bacteriovoracaceae bacterium]|nr:hypothetical protein [Bacteriovoracaceae bacterium]